MLCIELGLGSISFLWQEEGFKVYPGKNSASKEKKRKLIGICYLFEKIKLSYKNTNEVRFIRNFDWSRLGLGFSISSSNFCLLQQMDRWRRFSRILFIHYFQKLFRKNGQR